MAYKDKKTNLWVGSVAPLDYMGNKKRMRKYAFKTKKEALTWENAIAIEVSQKPIERIKLCELQKLFLIDNTSDMKQTTISKYKRTFKNVLSSLNDLYVDEITVIHLNKWRNELIEKNLSSTYINNAITTLSTLFKFGMNYVNIKENPTMKIKRVKSQKVKKVSYFTLEEYNKYESVIDELKFQTFFNVLYFCGLRRGEAIALNWTDVNFKNETISITKTFSPKELGRHAKPTPPKTKSSCRNIKLPKRTLDLLKQLYKNESKIDNFSKEMYVFNMESLPLTESSIKRKKDKYCKWADLKQITVHDFRHSHASLLINKGANIRLVANRLGHSDIEMTLNTYTHMFHDSEQSLIDILDKI